MFHSKYYCSSRFTVQVEPRHHSARITFPYKPHRNTKSTSAPENNSFLGNASDESNVIYPENQRNFLVSKYMALSARFTRATAEPTRVDFMDLTGSSHWDRALIRWLFCGLQTSFRKSTYPLVLFPSLGASVEGHP